MEYAILWWYFLFVLLFLSLRSLYIIFASDNLGDYQELRWLIRNGLKGERKTVVKGGLNK